MLFKKFVGFYSILMLSPIPHHGIHLCPYHQHFSNFSFDTFHPSPFPSLSLSFNLLGCHIYICNCSCHSCLWPSLNLMYGSNTEVPQTFLAVIFTNIHQMAIQPFVLIKPTGPGAFQYTERFLDFEPSFLW